MAITKFENKTNIGLLMNEVLRKSMEETENFTKDPSYDFLGKDIEKEREQELAKLMQEKNNG